MLNQAFTQLRLRMFKVIVQKTKNGGAQVKKTVYYSMESNMKNILENILMLMFLNCILFAANDSSPVQPVDKKSNATVEAFKEVFYPRIPGIAENLMKGIPDEIKTFCANVKPGMKLIPEADKYFRENIRDLKDLSEKEKAKKSTLVVLSIIRYCNTQNYEYLRNAFLYVDNEIFKALPSVYTSVEIRDPNYISLLLERISWMTFQNNIEFLKGKFGKYSFIPELRALKEHLDKVGYSDDEEKKRMNRLFVDAIFQSGAFKAKVYLQNPEIVKSVFHMLFKKSGYESLFLKRLKFEVGDEELYNKLITSII